MSFRYAKCPEIAAANTNMDRKKDHNEVMEDNIVCDDECHYKNDHDGNCDSDCQDHHHDEDGYNSGCNNDCYDHHSMETDHRLMCDNSPRRRVSLPEGCYSNAKTFLTRSCVKCEPANELVCT